MKKILLLHGPNLNLLGSREPQIYGSLSLDELNLQLSQTASAGGIQLNAKQSNSESQLIDWIQNAVKEQYTGLIFNPAAFTHTSIAIRDALLAVSIPFIEVHITNLYKREPFRQQSYFSDLAQGLITGLGVQGYFLALAFFINEH